MRTSKKYLLSFLLVFMTGGVTQPQQTSISSPTTTFVVERVYKFPFSKFLFFIGDTIFGAGYAGIWRNELNKDHPKKLYSIGWVDAFIKSPGGKYIIFSTPGATCLSLDKGETWEEKDEGSPLCLIALDDTSFLAGGLGNWIYRVSIRNFKEIWKKKELQWTINTPQTLLKSGSGRIFMSMGGIDSLSEGMYYSDDGGEIWQRSHWNFRIGDPYEDCPFSLADDGKENLMARDERRFYVSTDNGASWEKWKYELVYWEQERGFLLGRIIYYSPLSCYLIAGRGGIWVVKNFETPPEFIPIPGYPSKFMGMIESGERVYLSYGGPEEGLLELSPVISSVAFNPVPPQNDFQLYQNYPNPFNAVTKINFSIARPSNVKLTVYNILGQRVMTLVDKFMNAGVYSVDFDASNLPSGVYLYGIEAGDFRTYKKMILLK